MPVRTIPLLNTLKLHNSLIQFVLFLNYVGLPLTASYVLVILFSQSCDLQPLTIPHPHLKQLIPNKEWKTVRECKSQSIRKSGRGELLQTKVLCNPKVMSLSCDPTYVFFKVTQIPINLPSPSSSSFYSLKMIL